MTATLPRALQLHRRENGVKVRTGVGRAARRFAFPTAVIAIAALGALAPPLFVSTGAAGPCGPPVTSVIACENSLPGDPASDWQITGSGDASIQGFATQQSVNVGGTIQFKITTTAASYHFDILRMGYYGGDGARIVAAGLKPTLVKNQPACLTDATTGLVDCGNWSVSASWTVPSTAVSGIYFAHLVRDDDPSLSSHIYFVVRNDASHSDIVYQTSDSTWEAYNRYGGNDFYVGGPGPANAVSGGRAYAVSYNRPITTRDCCPEDFVWETEFPMVQFLEQNGYDVSYISTVDTDTSPQLLTQHKMFMDAGHDEYWSANMRNNVQAARDAGVSLAFFSGNNMYWKTRYSTSIDGSGTAERTIVCYKETWANAPIDPQDPPTWTGTWRDPRYSPPADGGLPENQLTGTLFTVNAGTVTLQVPYGDSQLRFWRNTTVASLTPGQVATLGSDDIGYEWNEDVDNGFRPPGLIDMSRTTAQVPQKLLDYGLTVGPATATHSLTLYRAASGALVFSSATVQWSWGLNDNHDGSGGSSDPSMQQATVNLFADMGAQPATLMSGLVPATRTTDTTPPSSTITSPSAGTTVTVNQPVTVSGTATDSGGGVVGGVEVSTDGGSTWHPATGQSSWSYTWVPTIAGTTTLMSRATDDSGNIEKPSAGVSVSVTISCPCSIWSSVPTPQTPSASDTGAVELGVHFHSTYNGYINGVRFYKGSGNTGTHVGQLWSSSGSLLASATFSGETSSGWQQVTFSNPVPVQANQDYVAAYYAPSGGYALDYEYFATGPTTAGYLQASRDGAGAPNGVFTYSSSPAFPSSSYESSNYWVDVVFTPSAGPQVASENPASGAAGVAPSTAISATFNRAVNPATVTLTAADSNGNNVAGSLSYNAGTFTATLTPSTALTTGTQYTATVNASDNSGNAMEFPFSWSFTTSGVRPCPCAIWSVNSAPATANSGDTNAVEIGVRFTSDVAGYINGIRFYKGSSNTGTHVGHLWTSTGTLIATATFSNETASGWQEADFSGQVSITANTTYVASYFAPAGNYSDSPGYFTAATNNAPLHALADSSSSHNGVYAYGGSGTFPSSSYNRTNYWVDVSFTTQPSSTIPTVISESPSAGATNAAASAPVTATFSQAVQPSVAMTLTDSTGHAVAGSVSYNSASVTATLTPTATLALGATYTASVNATGTNGVAMSAPFTWTFTTEGGGCPCTLHAASWSPQSPDAGDGNATELGVKFQTDLGGYISGIRFYKAAANTGSHIVNLWTSSGTLLASAASTNETASGWQQVTFPGVVALSANTTYIASYYAPVGHYSATPQGFASALNSAPLHGLASSASGGNGVYQYSGSSTFPTQSYNATDYGVDPVFVTSGAAAPAVTVSSTSPAAGATGAQAAVSATFSEAVSQPSVHLTLSDATGTAVAGTTAYNAATYTETFTPSSALAGGANYQATVSATDLYGHVMTPYSWRFITAGCPCTVWSPATVPPVVDAGDGNAVELGVKVRSDVSGYITGVRFYKSAANTGTHIGDLWSATGTVLASGTFAGESASGWQELDFSSPVAVTAGTVYVAGYYAPHGHYSVSSGGLAQSVDNPPLHALGNGVSGGDGVFAYGSSPAFPTSSYNAGNYYVDVVLQTNTTLAGDTRLATHVESISAGTPVAYQTTATTTGNAGAVYLYLDTTCTASQVAVGIYSDLFNSPNSLVAQATLAVPIAGAWNRVPIGSSALSAGTKYWIAFLTPSGSGTLVLRDGDGATASATGFSTSSTTLPSSWLGVSKGTSGAASAYAATA